MVRILSVAILAMAIVAAAMVVGWSTLFFRVSAQQGPEPRGSVSGLEVSSDTAGVLDVEWNEASPEPTDYRVSWALEGSSYLTWSDRSGNAYPKTESHQVSGLVEGASYKVRMRARYFETPQSTSPLWSGRWTDDVIVTIKSQPPSAPTGLTASSVTHDSVTLTWTAPDSGTVTGYKLFRGADADSRSAIADDTGGTDTTFTDSSVEEATQYFYSVLALSVAGDGTDSGIIIVNTPAGDEESTETSEQHSNDQLPEVEVLDAMVVTFRQPPSEHDASTTIDLTWDLSHVPVGVGWAIAADGVNGVLNVQGARYHGVRRVESGKNQSWHSRLTPHGYGDITITVNGTTNCSGENAVCDADGLMLLGGDQLVIRGPLGLTVSNAEVQEGPGATLDFVVSLNRPADRTVTVSYGTEDGTATAGSDYYTTVGSLTFVAGQSEQTVSVPVIEDPGDSGPEIVVFRLSSPTAAILYGEFAMGTITELAVSSQQEETDSAPGVSVADTIAQEGPGATLGYVVSLSHASDQPVTVTYKTVREKGLGAPRPEWDYHATSGSITFATGETEKTVSVRLREDEEEDGRENLTFALTSSSGATIADAEATGTILNTPKGQRLQPRYTNHDHPDWTPGQIFPTSITSTEDHTIDVAWSLPISYTALRFRINFAPVDPAVTQNSFPWDGADTGNHWVHYRLTTSTRLSGLIGGVEYKVRVQAQFPAEGQTPGWNGPWTRIMKITVAGDGDPPPPLATASTVSSPTPDQYANGQLASLKLTTSEPGSILVEWIPPSSPTGNLGPIPPDDYRVSWVKGDEPFPGSNDTAGNANVAGASYTLTGLDSGGTYRVRVRANYPAGSLYLQPAWAGPWTELQIVVASPDSGPVETTQLVVIPAVIPESVDAPVPNQYERGQVATVRLASPEAGNIQVTWTAPSLPSDQTPSAYHVNWARDQEPYPDSTEATGYAEVTGVAHTLTGLEDGETYRVRVRARYGTSSDNGWNGPWTELEIVSATPARTFSLTLFEDSDSEEPLVSAEQGSEPTTPLSPQAEAISHDDLEFSTYVSRVWVVSQHNTVQLSWKRPTSNVEYRIWRAPAGDSAYTVLAEGAAALGLVRPRGALGSRYYFTDTSVVAATNYKYAIQVVVVVVDTVQYSKPYEALASTTEWLAPPEARRLPESVPQNENGDYLLDVNRQVSGTVRTPTATDNFILTLEEGEAYRVELYDVFANDGGHDHSAAGGGDTFSGPITVDPTSNSVSVNSELQHTHGYHISLGSITQIANNRRLPYQSNDYRLRFDADWREFWDGHVFKSCCSGEHLSYVFYAPAAGDYRVQVRTDYGPTQYGFKVTKIPDQPDIPSFRQRHGFYTTANDMRITNSTVWGHNAVVLGNIGVDDQDWFAVELEGGKSYRVTLAAGGNLEWQGLSNPRFVAMAGPDGVQVQPNFQGRKDRFRLNVPRDEGGYYHLGVSGASDSDRGPYVFSIVEADFPTDPTAPVVNVGQQYIGMLDSRRDHDWIGAELTAGRTYRIQVSASYGDIGGRFFARFIGMESKVYDKNTNTLNLGSAFRMETASDHNGHVGYLHGQVASARWTVATSGLYFFDIKPGSGTGHNYGSYYFQIIDITP